MEKRYKFIGVIFSGILLLTGLKACTSGSENSVQKPNIVFILADDLGWSELGCYGNTFNETPHIDQLAKEGIKFTQAYASAPVCSPYRAALFTGQFPARVGIIDYLRPDDPPLSTAHITLAEILKRNGYATGMIGKWHLTGYAKNGSENEVRAVDHGFDEELVTEIKGVGNGANFYPYVFRKDGFSWTNVTEKKLPGNEYLTDRINFEALDFIERHKDEPFFLYVSHFAPHTILNGKPELVEKYMKKHAPGKSTREDCYLCSDQGLEGDPGHHWAGAYNPHLAAMLESIDNGVGLIRDKLKELGLAENTILVFTSDNGGEAPNVTSNAPLRGGKSQLYEGGIRIPLLVCWLDNIGANTISDQFTANVDYYPTFLEAAGIEGDPDQQLDGVSIVKTMFDPDQHIKRDAFYWHYPLEQPHFLGGRSSGAIRKGNWKLIEYFETGDLELYNLDEDLGETENLVDKHPELVKELYRQLISWRLDVNLVIPDGQ